MTQPPAHPPAASPPYGQGPGWSAPYRGPAPGPWGAPPPPQPPHRRRTRTTIALVTGGAVLAAALVAVVVVAGLHVGRTQAAALAGAGGSLGTGGNLRAGGGFGPAPTTAPPTAPPVGDDPGLDGYAQRCHDGLLSACGDLYSLSPPMSGYERYGVTCGGRIAVPDVATCEDLDGD